MSYVEVDYRDDFSVHGESIIHFYDRLCVTKNALTWPDIRSSRSEDRDLPPVVAKTDGVVAGRAFMEAEFYPFAELVNLYVAPYARGKGVGHALVKDIVTQVSELGYLAVHLQTELDNKAAQNLYKAHGFLPAQQGEMLRMIRFLNLPILSSFLAKHPLVRFDSKSSDGQWMLQWSDFVGNDTLTIYLSGGSCQGDSEGFAPGISQIHYATADMVFEANIEGPESVEKDQELEMRFTMANNGGDELAGALRLMLNYGFIPGKDSSGAMEFRIDAGSSEMLVLPVSLTDAFDTEAWKYSSYPSVGVGVEVFVGQESFWLVSQTKISIPSPQ